MTNKTIAILGLGAMGLPIASRLNERFDVRGFDVSADRISAASEIGISTFASAQETVEGVDQVLLAVRDGEQLNKVLFSEEGIAQSLAPDSLVILTSTVGQAEVREVAESLVSYSVGLVDAPLSGGPVRAGNGDLLIVVGAKPEHLAKVQAVFDHIASSVTVVGERAGDGQALKAVNQLLCGVHIVAAAEALSLAEALGLDLELTLEALESGAAASFMLSDRGRRMLHTDAEGDTEVLSQLDIFVKDMAIVSRTARDASLATPVAAVAEQLFLIGRRMGLGSYDDSAVRRVIAGNPTAAEN